MAEADRGTDVVATALKRLLALIALVAVAGAVWAIASSSGTDRPSGPENGGEPTTATVKKDGEPTPREYVISEGDTLLAIADRYGISVKRIERLNPDLDTNTLATGVVLTLR